MSQNGTYRIDVNNIRPGGNKLGSGVYITDEHGTARESFYAVRGTGNGNVVVFDKVLYLLSANTSSISNVDAAGATYNASSYITKNQRKHGDGTIDSDLALSEASLVIEPNTSTTQTKSGTWVITQFDDSAEFNSYTGDSVSITWTQEKDYVSSSTYTISGTKSDSSNIPVTGGSDIRTVTVSSKRKDTYRSGNVVDNISCNFKVANLSNVTLTYPNGTPITTETSIADGTVVHVSFSSNAHNTTTRTCSFDIVCEGTTVKQTISWTENADSDRETGVTTTTTLSTQDTTQIPATGGTRTVKFTVTNVHHYAWYSDDEPSRDVTDYTGSTTLSFTACSSTSTTLSNDESAIIDIGPNGFSDRTVSVSETLGNKTVSWTQVATAVVLTAITLDNLTWVTDVPATGGTATSANCSYKVTGHYSDGSTGNVTTQATVTGQTVVAASSVATQHTAGTLTLTASYGGFSSSDSVTIYQAGAGENLTASCSVTTPPSGQSTATLTISSNISWGISTNVTWITVDTPLTGSGNATRGVTFAANPNTETRTGKITVTGGSVTPREIVITQDAAYSPGQTPTIVLDGAFYEILPANQTVTLSSAGTRTSPALNIFSDTNLTWSFDTTTIPGWLYVGRTGGSGSYEVVVSGAPNESDFRSTTVKINLRFGNGSVYGVPQESIIVKQDEASPTPPTPTTPTFHMSNSSNVYDLYGNFTITTTGTLSGDWPRGTSRDMYLSVPFNITAFSGAVLKGSTSVSWPSKVRFTIGSNYYDMSVSVNPSDEGVVNWTGTIPISQGDNVVISFL